MVLPERSDASQRVPSVPWYLRTELEPSLHKSTRWASKPLVWVWTVVTSPVIGCDVKPAGQMLAADEAGIGFKSPPKVPATKPAAAKTRPPARVERVLSGVSNMMSPRGLLGLKLYAFP